MIPFQSLDPFGRLSHRSSAKALVVGEEVEIRGFDWDGTPQGIVAICRRKGRTYRVNATAIEWAGRAPVGVEWFDAYRAWLKGNW